MPHVDLGRLELFLTICKRKTPDDPIHWMIMLRHPGAERCTWLHCTGVRGDRETEIEENKRYSSWGIDTKDWLVAIPAQYGPEVIQEARALPKQSCRWWSLYLILRLEIKGLMPQGTFKEWEKHRRTGSTENFGTGCLGKCSRSRPNVLCARILCSNPECGRFNCRHECLGETY
ncbi:hypothetical protein N7508_001147 [Penicillium antarcticum]|uniref:uncharacterized protein n=1 Tax=Penicillium antarcticum TaxID=416450 RepID=UPI00239905CB|nr:uncharacterized protein N7508_001147 [Penicillium antarcticum]KAJ5316639.1 hypothetical protein N7508_001147 [Penicillium antarcticum]